jgi:hypothetical protein
MPKPANYIPKLGLHKASGQAVVAIDGRDVYLGKHGTPEAQQLRTAYGTLPAAEFGPLKLKAVRERFIIGDVQYDRE